MNFRALTHACLPFATLFLAHCVTDEASESRPEKLELATTALAQSALPFNATQYTMARGDWDGNGKKDLFFFGNDGDIHVRLSNGSNYSTYLQVKPTSIYNLSTGNFLLGDWNGDGKTDIYFIRNDGETHIFESNGSGYVPCFVFFPGAFGSWSLGKYLIGDFDGNGQSDIYFIGNNGNVSVRLAKKNAYGQSQYYGGDQLNLLPAGDFGSWSGGRYYTGDLDGNAKSDLFFIGNSGDVHVRLSNGLNYGTYKKLLDAGEYGTLSSGQYAVADFDGNGQSDLFFIGNDGDVHARLSNGFHYANYKKLLNAGAFGNIAGGQYYVGDFDGNGQSDLFFIGNGGDVHVRLSNGTDYYNYNSLLNAGAFGTLTSGMYK